jgi:hypothetical protein
MHFFAVFVLFSFAVLGLTLLGERLYRRRSDLRAVVAAGLGVGLAWLANFNMWLGWAVPHLRWAWVGVTLTGLALGGAALAVYAVLGFFFGLHRKFDDQAEEIEQSKLRRVA